MTTNKPDALTIQIIDFTEETKDAIRILNIEWLEKYFHVEPGDAISLSDPVGEIINKGGSSTMLHTTTR